VKKALFHLKAKVEEWRFGSTIINFGIRLWIPRHPDFGRTVPILRAVFHIPPGYMVGHTFVLF
jgi:hypothetical protein